MVFKLLLIVCVFGGIGGIVNALLTENGFILPKTERSETVSVIRPGFLVNIIVGAVAAGISFGLYGPFAAEFLIPISKGINADLPQGLSLSSAVGAVLVGIGGAKWLTNEVDKKLLRGAASNVASSQQATQSVVISSPAEAFQLSARYIEKM